MAEQPFVKAYHGETFHTSHSRHIREIESMWDLELPCIGKFDGLMRKQLELALRQGRDTINFLYLGSGNGTIFKDFLQRTSDQPAPLTHELLAQHPHLRLNMIGFTDAPTEESFLTAEKIESNLPIAGQVDANNLFYTLTHRQSLERFLEEVDMAEVDLALAIHFFDYLHPIPYEDTLRTLLARLREGTGSAIIFGFNNPNMALSVDPDINEIHHGRSKDDLNSIVLRRYREARQVRERFRTIFIDKSGVPNSILQYGNILT